MADGSVGDRRMARPALLPSLAELVPWTDRRGRFHPLRFVVLLLVVVPGAWLLLRWGLGWLGAEPLNAAIHATGYDAVWLLLLSLVITPLRALAGSPNLVVVRRLVGNAALFYALIHLVLYATDQHWRLGVIASEIVLRFYLTIGFVALLGLVVLGVTSTDGWARFLGAAWKRLHRVVYALTVLALFHYVLQSKLDVSRALLAVGVFAWLMLWRQLPAGRDRSWLPLLLLGVGATLVTTGCEFLWYRFGTRINVARVMAGELDVSFGLHPAAQVAVLSAFVTVVTVLQGLRWPTVAAVGMYALGGLASGAVPWFFGWQVGDVAFGDVWAWEWAAAWVVGVGLLGMVRCRVAEGWRRYAVDALWAACLLFEVVRLSADEAFAVQIGAAGLAVALVLVVGRLWPGMQGAVLAVVPLVVMVGWRAVSA